MEYLRLRAREVAERLLARVPRGEDACVMKTWRAGGEGGAWENAFIGAVTLRALARLRTVFWDEVLDDVVAQAEAYAQAASVRFAAAYPHGDARVVDALAVQAIRGMQNAQAVRNDTRALLNAYSGAG